MNGWQIAVPAHGRWLPLPLEGDVGAQVATSVQALTGDDPEAAELLTGSIARTALVVGTQIDELELEGIPTLRAWSLLPASGSIQPGPAALLRSLPLAHDATDDDVIRTIVTFEAERYRGVDVDQLETASGRAWTVRWRPVVRAEDGARMVHEQRAVLWPDRRNGLVLALSVYVVDLLDGAGVQEPLHELAAGIRWSLT